MQFIQHIAPHLVEMNSCVETVLNEVHGLFYMRKGK